MSQTARIIGEVNEALAGPHVLDRDLVKRLVDLARALELGLEDACRTNLELAAMDQNVISATNALKLSCEALLRAYTQKAQIDPAAIANAVEVQIKIGAKLASDQLEPEKR